MVLNSCLKTWSEICFARKWQKVRSPFPEIQNTNPLENFCMLQNKLQVKESEWLWFWLFSPTEFSLFREGEGGSGRPVDVFAHWNCLHALVLSLHEHFSVDVCCVVMYMGVCVCMSGYGGQSEGLTFERVFALIAAQTGETFDRIGCLQTKKTT